MLTWPDFKEKNIVICFASEGQKISFKNDNLIILDDKQNIILQSTCHRIFSLWITGHATLTSGILEKSKKFGFSIQMLSHNHKPYGLWNCSTEGNFLLRKKQYDYNSLNMAKHLVSNKIFNQQALLKTIRSKPETMKNTIEMISRYSEELQKAGDLQAVLGIEGISTRLYFRQWFEGLDWNGRRPRTKIDFINTTMDIGYTCLFNFIEAMLNLYGFDVYQGVYHRCFYQRKSLVCDIIEPFRCIIDKQIKRAHGLNQLQQDHFKEQKGQYFLRIEKNKEYTRWLVQAILDYKEDIFSYVQNYYRCFMRSKPIEQYPIFKIKE